MANDRKAMLAEIGTWSDDKPIAKITTATPSEIRLCMTMHDDWWTGTEPPAFRHLGEDWYAQELQTSFVGGAPEECVVLARKAADRDVGGTPFRGTFKDVAAGRG